jgi:hypothetical protein
MAMHIKLRITDEGFRLQVHSHTLSPALLRALPFGGDFFVQEKQ